MLRLTDESDVGMASLDKPITVQRRVLWAFVLRYADSTYNHSQCRGAVVECRGDTSDPHRFPDCPAADLCLVGNGPLWDFDPHECAKFLWKAITGEDIDW